MILIAQERVITLVRPKKHSIHPSGKPSPRIRLRVFDMKALDLHVLVNTIYAPSIINSSASASWLPICLPKFNSSAFVNTYVMFLPRNDLGDAHKKTTPEQDTTSTESNAVEDEEGNDAPSSQSLPPGTSTDRPTEIALVCVSGSTDFEAVRNWCDTVSHVRLSSILAQ